MNRVSRLLPPSADYLPPARSRPVGVVITSVLGILFGAMGMFWKPLALVMLLSNPNPDAPVMSLDVKRWAIYLTVAGTLTSLLLLTSAAGSMSLRRWGRWGMLLYAAVAVGLTVTNYYGGQHLARLAGQAPGRLALPYAAVALLYPAAIAYAFLHPEARRAFAR